MGRGRHGGARAPQIFTVGQKAMQNSGKTLKFRKNFDVLKNFFGFSRKLRDVRGNFVICIYFFGMSPPLANNFGEKY